MIFMATNQEPRTRPGITPNIVLRRSHLQQLLTEPVEVLDYNKRLVLTISLHEDAELVANLIAHADLTDPRGTETARFRLIEPAIRIYLDDPSPANFEALELAYQRTFTA